MIDTIKKTKNRPKWYMSPPKIVSKVWTLSERYKLYTHYLNFGIDQNILNRMKITRIQANNQIRMMRKALSSKCYKCGRKLKKEELVPNKMFVLCFSCKNELSEYKKERANHFIKKGICPHCEKEFLYKSHKSCKMCLSSTYRRRVSKGLCGRCGINKIRKDKKFGKHKALCDSCAEQMRVVEAV